MNNELDAIEPWLADLASNLEPRARKRLATKIGQAIRRSNSGRIARNEEPDGTAMAARKPRMSGKSGRIKRRGKMFRKIRLVRNMKLRADPDGVEIYFGSKSISRVAAEHHYGSTGRVGNTRDGRTIRAKYEARRLLGFGRDDRDAALDAAAKHLAE